MMFNTRNESFNFFFVVNTTEKVEKKNMND